MKSIITLICFLCLTVPAARSATHYVVPTNTGAANPYTNWTTAGTSLNDVVKAAITNANTPRIIWVTNGAYVLTNSVIITNAVALKSVNGRDVTILNGNNLYRIVVSNGCAMEGLTVQNGFYNNSVIGTGGGGIDVVGGTVSNCMIIDCMVTGTYAGGGGIHIVTGTVENCIIRRNTNAATITYGGGGIAIEAGQNAIIRNCIIEKNVANPKGKGAGIYIGNDAAADIRNCLISENISTNAYAGGGLALDTTNKVFIANCTIVSNCSAVNGGGIIFYTQRPYPSDVATSNWIVNCIIQSNSMYDIYDYYISNKYAIAYSCSQTNRSFILDARGNTTNDPKFTSFLEKNYHFDRTSPCFNSGTNQDWMANAIDLDGRARILHGTADMGVYEFLVPSGTIYRFLGR